MGIPKQTHCKRGHERTAENVGANYTCLLCKRLTRPPNPETSKACAWCNEVFTTRKTVQVYCCRQCHHCAHQRRKRIADMTDERKAHLEELRLKREKRTAWRLVHPGQPYRWYTDLTPEEKKRINRVEQLKESGWTMETFAAAKEAQGGKCAICGDTPIPAAHCSEGLHADHQHVKPPMPRALLCPRCNSGIGQFLESPERCEAAAEYLRHWNA
jgi:hypothetical protein